MEFVDVWSRSDITAAPSGFRYLDFIGGERELRCYLVPQHLPRCQFMVNHAYLLDPSLAPIYQHNGACVRQDASYALPGFYVVSLTDHYVSMDTMDETTHLRMAFIIQQLRKGMRDILGIKFIHLHYEEKPDLSCNVHYWVMPAIDPETGATTVIMRLNIREYLSGFRFSEQRNTIQQYNRQMVQYFDCIQLSRRDDELSDMLGKRRTVESAHESSGESWEG